MLGWISHACISGIARAICTLSVCTILLAFINCHVFFAELCCSPYHCDLRSRLLAPVSTTPTKQNREKGGTTSPKPTAGTNEEGPEAATMELTNKKGRGPPHQSKRQAPTRKGGAQRLQGPQLGNAKDHPTQANVMPEPEITRNCTDGAFRKERHGTTSTKPAAGRSQDWRGIAPAKALRPSARNGEGQPTQPKLAASSNQDGRRSTPTGPSFRNRKGPPHQSQQQAPTRIGGERHPQGSPPGLARDHPPHRGQLQAPARNSGEQHPHGPPPGLARECPTQGSSWSQPRMTRNSTHRVRRQNRRGTNAPKPAAGSDHDCRRTAPTLPSAKMGEGPPPQPPKASSRTQPGMVGSGIHRALREDLRGTTPPNQATGPHQERGGTRTQTHARARIGGVKKKTHIQKQMPQSPATKGGVKAKTVPECTPQTLARSGGVKAEPVLKCTHHKLQARIGGVNANPVPRPQAARSDQDWRDKGEKTNPSTRATVPS